MSVKRPSCKEFNLVNLDNVLDLIKVYSGTTPSFQVVTPSGQTIDPQSRTTRNEQLASTMHTASLSVNRFRESKYTDTTNLREAMSTRNFSTSYNRGRGPDTVSGGGDNIDATLKAIKEQKLVIKKVIKDARQHKTPFRFH